jgi:hypothetical protein
MTLRERIVKALESGDMPMVTDGGWCMRDADAIEALVREEILRELDGLFGEATAKAYRYTEFPDYGVASAIAGVIGNRAKSLRARAAEIKEGR